MSKASSFVFRSGNTKTIKLNVSLYFLNVPPRAAEIT